MANKYALSEATPANTDDALEGPLRIREVKQAYNERLGRDHYMGQVSNPDVIAGGADSTDSGYHRRITITELTSDQGSTVDARMQDAFKSKLKAWRAISGFPPSSPVRLAKPENT